MEEVGAEAVLIVAAPTIVKRATSGGVNANAACTLPPRIPDLIASDFLQVVTAWLRRPRVTEPARAVDQLQLKKDYPRKAIFISHFSRASECHRRNQTLPWGTDRKNCFYQCSLQLRLRMIAPRFQRLIICWRSRFPLSFSLRPGLHHCQ